MKYYKIITDTEIGFQVLELDKCDDLINKKLYQPYPNEKIECLGLDKRVKITDVLSVGTSSLKGLIIKNGFCDILRNFDGHKIQFVKISGNNLDSHEFMFFNGDLTNNIDYGKSEFRVVKKGLLRTKILDIAVPPNRDDVVRIDVEECSDSIFNEIEPANGYHFLPDFDLSKYDIFRIGHFDLNFYVSEKVKDALEKNNITGCEFIEQEKFTIE